MPGGWRGSSQLIARAPGQRAERSDRRHPDRAEIHTIKPVIGSVCEISRPLQKRWGRGSGPGGPGAVCEGELQIGTRPDRDLQMDVFAPELPRTPKRLLTTFPPAAPRSGPCRLDGEKTSKPRSFNALEKFRHGEFPTGVHVRVPPVGHISNEKTQAQQADVPISVSSGKNFHPCRSAFAPSQNPSDEPRSRTRRRTWQRNSWTNLAVEPADELGRFIFAATEGLSCRALSVEGWAIH